MKITRYIIIRNGTETRMVAKRPRLDGNEIAFQLNLTVPQPPRLAGSIDIELPEPPPVDAAHITVAEWLAAEEDDG